MKKRISLILAVCMVIGSVTLACDKRADEVSNHKEINKANKVVETQKYDEQGEEKNKSVDTNVDLSKVNITEENKYESVNFICKDKDDNHIEWIFEKFNGISKEKKINLDNDMYVTLDYFTEIEDGKLNILFLNPENEIIENFEANKQDLVEIKIPESGEYKIKVVGEEAHNGMLDVSLIKDRKSNIYPNDTNVDLSKYDITDENKMHEEIEGKVSKNNGHLNFKFKKYSGMYTFYQYDFKKGQNITLEYSSNLERGKFNILVLNSDYEIIKKLEANKTGSEELVVPEDGIYIIKAVGDRCYNGNIDLEIK